MSRIEFADASDIVWLGFSFNVDDVLFEEMGSALCASVLLCISDACDDGDNANAVSVRWSEVDYVGA